eukprot:CAMPEP_0170621362 /NCGR_PEP_ID=MMETSP0224-20130122/28560_1 /TAXON_ID=285029 /ORGANISM="Togula jolla, Strain CCCM 725" /LENGTH=286 /DNA_ID=CAMNT_0010947615 /DNA_START=85 /DNA_END=942 /DNA_ORIENTATION=-
MIDGRDAVAGIVSDSPKPESVKSLRSQSGSIPPMTPPAATTTMAKHDGGSGAMAEKLDALEARMTQKMTEALAKSERQRDLVLSGYDGKLAAVESFRHRMESNIAEVKGSCRTLSDFIHPLIRRVEEIEKQMWESRREIEEDFRTKLEHVADHGYKRSQSTHSCESEEIVKCLESRLAHMESLASERYAQHKECLAQPTSTNIGPAEDGSQASSAFAETEPVQPAVSPVPHSLTKSGETERGLQSASATVATEPVQPAASPEPHSSTKSGSTERGLQSASAIAETE